MNVVLRQMTWNYIFFSLYTNVFIHLNRSNLSGFIFHKLELRLLNWLTTIDSHSLMVFSHYFFFFFLRPLYLLYQDLCSKAIFSDFFLTKISDFQVFFTNKFDFSRLLWQRQIFSRFFRQRVGSFSKVQKIDTFRNSSIFLIVRSIFPKKQRHKSGWLPNFIEPTKILKHRYRLFT